MQSSRLLRAVDWFIDVPKDPAQFKNRSVYSTIFSIEYNNIVTKWGLSHNLNGKYNYVISRIFCILHLHHHDYACYG